MGGILVPLDGSAPARRALRHAQALARATHATLHLANVQPAMPLFGVVRATMDADEYHAACATLARKALGTVPRGCRTHVLYGDAGHTIAEAAHRLRCGAIVMGTRGRGAATSLVLGSVALKVARLARVPVTLVK